MRVTYYIDAMPPPGVHQHLGDVVIFGSITVMALVKELFN
jgi:hypothetical protein